MTIQHYIILAAIETINKNMFKPNININPPRTENKHEDYTKPKYSSYYHKPSTTAYRKRTGQPKNRGCNH